MHAPEFEHVPPLPPALPADADAATLPPSPLQEVASALTHDFLPASPQASAPPQLPGYEILQELGRGGMGVVYQARHLGLNRIVAVKMILAGAFADERLLSRFKAEAEVLARLQHPNIVQVYDIGSYEGKTYFTLEYIAGGSLDRVLHATPQPHRAAAALVAHLADGMQAAHEQGIVHRDLKPGNVLLQIDNCRVPSENQTEDPRPLQFAISNQQSTIPKITDFGLAKQASSQLTATGVIMGTPSYMAPEQAEAKREVGPAVDIYALGAILYEMLTGRPPFVAATPLDTVMQVLHDEPVPPTKLQPKLPRDLETICLKCLQKDPAKRYVTAAALAADLRRFLNEEPIIARPVGGLERAVKWAKRRPTVAGLLATLVLVVATALGGLLALWWEADTQRLRAVEALAEADRQKNDAQTMQQLAEQRAAALNERLYAVDMMQAHDAWHLAELSRLNQQLDPYQDSRLRGFEWYYYRWLLDRTNQVKLSPQLQEIPFVVQTVAYHPDGAHLAVAGEGQQVQIWNTRSKVRVRHWSMRDAVRQLTYLAKGRTLLAACGNELQFWNPATGEQVRALAVSDAPVTQISVSEDERWATVVDDRNHFSIWDLTSNRRLRHGNRRDLMAVSPDGEHVVAHVTNAGDLFNVHLTRIDDDEKHGFNRERKDVRTYVHRLRSVAVLRFNPEGDRVAIAGLDSSDSGSVRIFDVASAEEVCRCSGGMKQVRCLAFSPNGKLLATASEDNTVRLWDARTGKEVRRFRGQGYLYNALAFSPDGQHLAAGSQYARVEVWPTSTVQDGEVHQPWPPNMAGGLLLHPDGRHLLIMHTMLFTMEQFTLEGKRALRVGTQTRGAVTFRYSPEGRFLAIGHRNGLVRLLDARTGQLVRTLEGLRHPVRALAFSPDGAVVAAVDAVPRPDLLASIQLWQTATGQPLARLENHPDLRHASQLALGPGGQWLATGHSTLAFHLWNVAERQRIVTFNPPQKAGNTPVLIALDPQARYAVWAMPLGEIGGNSVQVYDAATGTPRFRLAGHAKPVSHLAFSPDGLRLATGSSDGTVRLWDLRTGQEVLRLAIPEETLTDLHFTADGQRLQALGRTNWVYTWPTLRVSP